MKHTAGFSLVEMMVGTILASIILTALTMVFLAAQSTWFLTSVQIQLQNDTRQIISHVARELQESGRDSAGTLKTTISDNTGVGGTDVLEFSVPVCICGISAIDTNGNVRNWGAPSRWGQAGCSDQYTVEANGKVDICHVPPGNPGNTQSLNVNPSSVKAHLAHGDWLGACNACDPNSYNNRFVQYLLNNSGQLVRQVLDQNDILVSQEIVAGGVTDFQTSFVAGQDTVTVTLTVSRKALKNRTMTITASVNAYLRNRS